MVNYDNVLEKLKRGAYVGAGTFVSSFVGNAIEDFTPLGGIGVALGQVGVGAGVAVGTDMALGDPRVDVTNEEMVAQAGEFMGYGVIGAGFSELAENVQAQAQTGASADRVVDVRQAGAQTGQAADVRASSQPTSGDFSLDTA